LGNILIEMKCPQHGFERFQVKVIKRCNIASDQILPKLRSKPKSGEISLLYVGRNVSNNDVKNYIVDYFRDRGMLQEILRIRMLV